MISRANIIAWQQHAPWASNDQIEHDLVLSRAICELYNHPIINEQLAFRGGTALHKLFFAPSGRFSEDLDFVQITAAPIGTLVDAIRSCLDPWLGKPNWKQNQGRFTLNYRFDTEIAPIISRKVKIEINTREHFSVLGYDVQPYAVISPWFEGQAQVRTFHIEELLGTKLRALYQRKKGRDLYDLWYAIKMLPSLNKRAIVDVFKHYINFENKTISAAEFQQNLSSKYVETVFSNDIYALLDVSQVDNYRSEDAYEIVLRDIIGLLSYE